MMMTRHDLEQLVNLALLSINHPALRQRHMYLVPDQAERVLIALCVPSEKEERSLTYHQTVRLHSDRYYYIYSDLDRSDWKVMLAIEWVSVGLSGVLLSLTLVVRTRQAVVYLDSNHRQVGSER